MNGSAEKRGAGEWRGAKASAAARETGGFPGPLPLFEISYSEGVLPRSASGRKSGERREGAVLLSVSVVVLFA